MTLPVPTEDVEQATFVGYLRQHGIHHFRVPNETYTRSRYQKAKNRTLGVVAGIPDLFVVVPKPTVYITGDSIDLENKKITLSNSSNLSDSTHRLIGIEMKRRVKGASRVQPSQKEWIERLNNAGVETRICYGADEAIKFIESVTNPKEG